MATMDDQNNAPESWEQELNGGTGEGDQLSKELSSLNVNAPAFTPGINVHAQEFVPAFLKSPTEGSCAILERKSLSMNIFLLCLIHILCNYL